MRIFRYILAVVVTILGAGLSIIPMFLVGKFSVELGFILIGLFNIGVSLVARRIWPSDYQQDFKTLLKINNLFIILIFVVLFGIIGFGIGFFFTPGRYEEILEYPEIYMGTALGLTFGILVRLPSARRRGWG